MLLACDGIWDVLSNQQVCDFVVDKIGANTQPEDICEQLMDRYKDDILPSFAFKRAGS